MSQAPGLSGTPASGHCSSAATRASCASSSARPTSRTMRARPAMTLADSILQTAWIARCVSEAVTATDHSIFIGRRKAESCRRRSARLAALLLDLLAELLFPLRELAGGVAGSAVWRLEDLPDLDLGILEGGALEPFDRLFLRLHLPQPEPGDELLPLRKGPVDHGPLSLGELDPRALRARLEALGREHHPGLHHLFLHLPHVAEDLLPRNHARLQPLL